FEVMQHEQGDDFGLARNAEFRQLLRALASPAHNSRCVVSSRVPLLDLIAYRTYAHHEVKALDPDEGGELLRRLGGKGAAKELAAVVADWDGHPLSLSLLASYAVEHSDHSLKSIAEEWLAPRAGEARYERIRRVLARYDKNLPAADRDALQTL